MEPVVLGHRRPLASSVVMVDADGYVGMQQSSKSTSRFPLRWSGGSVMVDEGMPRLGRVRFEERVLDVFHVRRTRDELVSMLAPMECVEWVRPATLREWMVDDAKHISPLFRGIWRTFYDAETGDPVPPRHDIVHIHDEVSHATEASDHAILTPYSYVRGMQGKAVRSMLSKAVCRLLGVSEAKQKVIASTVEGIHNASLVADDIEDASQMRRGAPCAHHVFGTALSINAPYFAMFKILQRLASEPPSITRHVVDALVELHRGQGTDIQWTSLEHCPSEEDYLRMIDGKTGALFRLIAHLGWAYSAQDQTPLVDLCARMATFFQIRDDYCNICDPSYWERKGFFEDLDEGKRSFAVIHAFSHGSDEAKARLRTLLGMRGDATIQDKREAYHLLEETGSLRFTWDWLVEARDELVLACASSPGMTALIASLPIRPPPRIKEDPGR